MKNKLEKSIEQIKQVKMTAAEKEAILHRVLANKRSFKRVPSPLLLNRLMPVIGVFLIFILSGSTLLAAETSLPGDLLYPLKIKVLEPVGDLLTTDDTKKAERAAKKVNNRLDEAEKLAGRGELTADKITTIETELSSQVKKVRVFKEKVRAAKPHKADQVEQIYANLETRFAAHSEILNEVERETPVPQKQNIERLRKKARELDESVIIELSTFGGVQVSIGPSTSTPEFEDKYEDRKKNTFKRIKNAREEINTKLKTSEGLEKKVLENASNTLSIAEQKINDAEALKSHGLNREALEILRDAERRTGVADISAEKSKNFSKKQAGRKSDWDARRNENQNGSQGRNQKGN